MRETGALERSSEPNDAAWPMPTPPSLGLPNQQVYVIKEDTVLDAITELEWQAKVPEGSFTLQEAQDYCDALSLGELQDFRLPSRIELVSLLNLDSSAPAISGDVFPGTPGEWFWSSSPLADDATSAWYTYFYFGYPDVDSRESAFRVRCVASPPAPSLDGPRYDVAEGTVRDRRTALTFQRHAAPEPMTHEAAAGYCGDLELDGARDWRLPTMPELETLVDERVRSPAIDESAFSGTAPVPFWTGSGWAGSTELAWYVSFEYGAALYELKTTEHAVRCVH